MRNLIIAAAVLTLAACHQEVPCVAQPTAQQPTPTFQPPTATEAFHLRSECAKLGQEILAGNMVGAALTQDVTANYDARDNRCYVDLTVMTADMNVPQDSPAFVHSRSLYDGQTRELLAEAHIKNGQKAGIVYKGAITPIGFDPVIEYINAKMGD